MRIVIITQDDPFYLTASLNRLVLDLPKKHIIVGCVVSSVSPFGKQASFLKKAFTTFNVFGLAFFLHYTIKFLFAKFNINNSLDAFLKKHNIKKIVLKQSINKKESIKRLKQYNPDLLLSILGNQIFKKEIISLAPKGCINLHSALLPKYRGLMPTFWVMKNDETFTGVSVFYVDEGIDSGPIIIQKKIKVQDRTHAQLIRKTKALGMQAVIEAIEKIDMGVVQTLENNDAQMTYYSFPKKEDVAGFKKRKKKFF